jgi:hypothetical protein
MDAGRGEWEAGGSAIAVRLRRSLLPDCVKDALKMNVLEVTQKDASDELSCGGQDTGFVIQWVIARSSYVLDGLPRPVKTGFVASNVRSGSRRSDL